MTNIGIGTNPAPPASEPLQALRIMLIHLGYAVEFIQNAKAAANDGGHAEYAAALDIAAAHIDSLVVEINDAIAATEAQAGSGNADA
jgi:hypothetical protein